MPELRRDDLEQLISSGEDIETTRLRVEAMLELEKLRIERENHKLEEDRQVRERRQWWANPLMVAAAVAALSLLGDMVLSSIQRSNANDLQRQKQSSDLIVKAFNADANQTIANLGFLSELELVDVDREALLAAAEQYRPKSDTASRAPSIGSPVILQRPIFGSGTFIRTANANSVTLRVERLDSGLPLGRGFRLTREGGVHIRLAGLQAMFPSTDRCGSDLRTRKAAEWGRAARTAVTGFFGAATGQPVSFVLFANNAVGSFFGIVAKGEGFGDDPAKIYDASINRDLIINGHATPWFRVEMGRPLTDLIVRDADAAEDAKAGMYAEMDGAIDPANLADEIEPYWALIELYCRAAARTPDDIPGHLTQSLQTVGIYDLKSGEALGRDDLFSFEGDKVRIKVRSQELGFGRSGVATQE
ncbi:MAG: hypothetical protein QNJ16_03410 [Rhodobacter sp.]|nr:hypothetical protein [Rhodobacter sp.]